jgi:hypothetical protein
MVLRWDTSEVERLAVDLSRAPRRVQRRAGYEFSAAADRVRFRMKRLASGHRFLDELPETVGSSRFGPLDYEVGFDKVGQGKLANIIVYGSVNNAPVFDHTEALRMEIPELQRHLGDAGEDSVLGGPGER